MLRGFGSKIKQLGSSTLRRIQLQRVADLETVRSDLFCRIRDKNLDPDPAGNYELSKIKRILYIEADSVTNSCGFGNGQIRIILPYLRKKKPWLVIGEPM